MVFIPGSQHQARASYNFYNKFDHKAIIVALQTLRVKIKSHISATLQLRSYIETISSLSYVNI